MRIKRGLFSEIGNQGMTETAISRLIKGLVFSPASISDFQRVVSRCKFFMTEDYGNSELALWLSLTLKCRHHGWRENFPSLNH